MPIHPLEGGKVKVVPACVCVCVSTSQADEINVRGYNFGKFSIAMNTEFIYSQRLRPSKSKLSYTSLLSICFMCLCTLITCYAPHWFVNRFQFHVSLPFRIRRILMKWHSATMNISIVCWNSVSPQMGHFVWATLITWRKSLEACRWCRRRRRRACHFFENHRSIWNVIGITLRHWLLWAVKLRHRLKSRGTFSPTAVDVADKCTLRLHILSLCAAGA